MADPTLELDKHLAVLHGEPENAEALAAIERLAGELGNGASAEAALRLSEARKALRERGDQEIALRLLEVELQIAKGRDARAELLFEKAKILEDELLRQPEALEALKALVELKPDHGSAGELLGHVALVSANWEKIVKKYADEAKGSTDRSLATSLYLSAAEIVARNAPESTDFEQYLRRALDVDPRNRRAATHLERLLERQRRYEELWQVRQLRVESARTKEERIAALLGLAELASRRLSKPDEALESYRRVLAIEPLERRALSALAEAYTAAGDWSALVKLHEGALRARGRAGESDYDTLREIARLYAQKLDAPDQAEEYYRRIRKGLPSDPEALEFYRSFHAPRGETPKLLSALAQAQKAERDPEKRLGLAVEMARTAEGDPASIEKAIDCWKAVVRGAPKGGEAAREAMAALCRLYQKTEKWNALLELLKEEIEALPAGDVDGRIERYQQIVEIYRDRLRLDVMVINTYNNILALRPGHAGALDALAEKYQALGRWNDLIGALARKAEAASDAGEQVALLRRIASLWIERFGNHNQAIKPLERILEIAPTDPEALGMLKEIYSKRRMWRPLVELLRREAQTLPEGERRGRLAEVAKLAAERLGDLRAAIGAWNQALEIAPRDPEALAQLAQLYEREKRWPALVEVVGRMREAVGGDVKAAVPLLERMGVLLVERLGGQKELAPAAFAEGAKAFREILSLKPGHAKAVRVLREIYVDSGDLGALEAMYGSIGAWDELLETLHLSTDRVAEPEQKIRLLLRAAEICAEKIRQPERALRSYERILQIDPRHREAARALVPIYRAGEKWPKLLATYEVLLGHAEERGEKLELLGEIRHVCEDKLASKALAFQWCAQACEIAPEDEELGRELTRLAQETDSWEELARIHRKRLEALGPERAHERVPLLRDLGRLLFSRLARPEEAQVAFEELLRTDPDDAESRGLLEQMFTQGQKWSELLAISRQGLAREQDSTRRQEALFKIAFVEEERLGDLEAAAATYSEVLVGEPGNARALRALEKIYQARGAWRDLAGVYEEQLRIAADDEARVALLGNLAALRDQRLQEPRRAIEAYRQVLELSPQNRPAIAALERLVADLPRSEPARIAVARLLAPFYEREGDAAHLAGELVVLRDAADEVDQRLALDRRLLSLYSRKLGQPERAYEHCVEVLRAAPGDEENRREAAALAAEMNGWADLVERLGVVRVTVLERGDAALARDLLWEQAVLVDDKLARAEEAEKLFLKILEEEPGHEGAFDALDRSYRRRERWTSLRDLLERRQAETGDPDRRRELLFEIADLDSGQLADAEAACKAFERILEIDPSSGRAYEALEHIFASGKRWAELEELLARELSFVEDAAARAELLYRRAALRAEHLADAPGAVDLLEEVLSARPQHASARRALEELMGRDELRLRAARVLEPVYAGTRETTKLVAVLRVQRELAGTPAEGVELCARIARLEEEDLGSRQAALATWREALRLDPTDAQARDAVDRLTRILERWSDAAEAWEEALRALPAPPGDVALHVDLLARAARLYEQRLGNPSRAAELYRRMLDADPGNVEVLRPATEALDRLFTSAARWSDLIDLLRRQCEWTEDPAARKALLFRRAEIHEVALAAPDAAAAAYKEIAELDPEDRRSLDELERLYQRGAQWRELLDVLRRKVEVAREGAERRTLRTRVARYLEQELGSPAEAIAAYHELLDEAPEDAEALEQLTRLYRAAARWPDLLEILERRLSLAKEDRARLPLLADSAALLEGDLGRRADGFERWSEILRIAPDHEAARQGVERALADEDLRLRAAEILEPLYAARGDNDRLVSLHELFAEHGADPREKLARLRRAAAIYEQKGDLDAAFNAFARAARAAVGEPELEEIVAESERLARARASFEELVKLYREIEPDVLDGDLKLRLNVRVAEIARTILGDEDTAREFYRRVLDGQPGHAGALSALEEIYRAREEWEPLLGILQRRVELAAEHIDERERYLLAMAHLCDDKLHQTSEAIAAYEQILDISPASAEVVQSLDRLYQATERWQDLANLLERRLGFASDIAEAVALRFRLGEVWQHRLAEHDRAVENYGAVLSGDPAHAGAIAALERYLEDPAQQASAAEVLEPVYAGRQDWQRLVRIYEIRLAATDDAALRMAFTRRLARLYEEQLEDLDGAFQWFGRVLREDPTDRATRDQLVRLANVLGRWEALAELYARMLQDVGDEGEAMQEIARQLAQIYDQKVGDVGRARDVYKRLLEQRPEDDDTLRALIACLTRAERWTDLLDIYAETAERTLDLDRKKAYLFERCRIYEEVLGDRGQAIAGLRQVLEIDAQDAKAVGGLDRLLTQEGRWGDLADLLLRRLEAASSDEAVEVRRRLGELYETRLNDLTSAIDEYERILAERPGEVRAIAALERLVLNEDHRFRIAQILEPLYRAGDQWAKLAVILDAELPFIDDRARRIEILREIAQLHETRGGQLDLAFAAIARAFREDVAATDDLAVLERLAARTQSWEGLVRELLSATEGLYDEDLVIRLLGRAAAVEETQRDDRARAIDVWRRVLKVREDHAEALAALDRLLGEERRHAEQAEIIERRAELSSEPTERKELLRRAAGLREEVLDEPDRAVGDWKAVLAVADDDGQALEALARLHRRRGAFRELVDVQRRQVELAVAPAARRATLLAMAEVYERELHDVFEAVGALRQALELSPDDDEALAALDRLYQGEKQWPELLDVLEARLRIAPDASARAEIGFRAGRLFETELGEPARAIERYREVLTETPGHDGARQALWGLAQSKDHTEHREAAAAALMPILQAESAFDRLVELAELRLALAQDPADRRALLADIAELHETGRGDLALAFRAWARALVEDPSAVEVQLELDRLARQRGSYSELAACLEERLAAADDPELARRFVLKLAAIYEEELHDAGKAAAKLRQVLEYPGDERGPLAALDRILARAGVWEELAGVLAREAEAAQAPAEQAAFLFRLGELRETQQNDAAGALVAYRDVVQRDPESAGARAALERLLNDERVRGEAIQALEPLYEAEGDFARLLELLELRLSIAREPADRVRVLERIAEIADQRLGDQVRALDAVGRALAEDAGSEALLAALERLADATGRWPEAAARVSDVLAALGGDASPDLARDLSLHLGAIYADRLQDDAQAEERYQAVLAIDGAHEGALEALDLIYRRRGDAEKLGGILARRAAGEGDPGRRREILAELAELREGAHDADGAAAAWRQVLEIEEGDAAATAALARLYEESKRWEDLVSVLGLQARFEADPVRQRALLARTADVLAEKIGDLERAAAAYRAVLDLAPDDDAALVSLERVLTKRSDWLGVQEVILHRLTIVPSSAAKQLFYERLAKISEEKRQSVEEAIGYYQQLLELDPNHVRGVPELERLLAKAESWHELIEHLTRRADIAAQRGDEAGEIAALARAAEIWEGRLESPDGARELLERVLSRDPNYVPALMTLARIYEGQGNLDGCASILQRALGLAPSASDAAELCYRLGEIQVQRTGNLDEARLCWEQAIARNPAHRPSILALEKLARDSADVAGLASVLLRREATEEGPAKVVILKELAQLYTAHLGQPLAAVPLLERALALAPDDAELMEPLAEAYFFGGREAEASQLYATLIAERQKARRMKDVARFRQRLGAIAERSGDVQTALREYEEAFRLDATHAPTLAALGRLYFAQSEWEKARRVYRSMLLQNLDPSVGVSKAEVYLQLGLIHARLGEAPKARNMYERGLEVEPNHAGLRQALADLK